LDNLKRKNRQDFVKIKSIKFFSKKKLLINSSDKLLKNYEIKKNKLKIINFLYLDNENVYFTMPIDSRIISNKAELVTLSKDIPIDEIFLTTKSKIEVLNQDMQYRVERKSRFFLYKIFNHNFFSNFKRTEIRPLKFLKTELKKKPKYFFRLSYGATFDEEASFDLEIIDQNNKKIYFNNLKPNMNFNFNLFDKIIIKNINFINLNNLKKKYFDKFEIFEEILFSEINNKIGLFDFPLLVNFNERELNIDEINSSSYFRKGEYDQGNLVYKIKIKPKNTKFQIDLNKYFFRKNIPIDLIYLFIQNKENNFEKKTKSTNYKTCPVYLSIKTKQSIKRECIQHSNYILDLNGVELDNITSIMLNIDNQSDIFSEYFYLSGINLFKDDLILESQDFREILSSKFNNHENSKVLVDTFLKNYYYIHPGLINTKVLRDF
jgi:hypothetical protein